jgi:hypothetical protein
VKGGHAPDRQHHAAHARDRSQDQAFEQQLPDDSCTARTDREADRQLPCAHPSARKQEPRDVRARDEQHAPGSGEEEQERPPHRRLDPGASRRLGNAPHRVSGSASGSSKVALAEASSAFARFSVMPSFRRATTAMNSCGVVRYSA